MDLLSSQGGEVALFDPKWPIYARTPIKPPQVLGKNGVVKHSMVTGGCVVDGTVANSVLFHSVTVEEGANVRYSILMPGAVVKAGATVEYAIVAENAVIGTNAVVGTEPPAGEDKGDWGIAVVASDLEIGDGAVVPANAMVTSSIEAAKEG